MLGVAHRASRVFSLPRADVFAGLVLVACSYRFVRAAIDKRVEETNVQMHALRDGLNSVVPLNLLQIFSAAEVELLVCGSVEVRFSAGRGACCLSAPCLCAWTVVVVLLVGLPVYVCCVCVPTGALMTDNLWFQVDLNLLRANTAYDAPYRANSAPVQLMWQALESFSHVERSLFLRYALRPVSPATTSGCVTPSHCQRTIDIDLFMLCLLVLAVTIVALVGRFVWGRSRLPSNGDFAGESFKVRPLQCSNANMSLPESATCFFRIKLPKYTDLNACKDRLR